MPGQHYLIIYRPPRATFAEDITEEESAVIGDHFDYLKRLHEEGQLVLAGRTEDASMGLFIFEADDRAAAERIMRDDPAVKGGVFSAELHPYRLALLKESEK